MCCDEGWKEDYLHNDRGRGKDCVVTQIKGNFFLQNYVTNDKRI